ncbi:heterokaryon incompatibility protein-domain-containing protein [Xylariaceae sp. AK1471]|nr:heterokaryon incompatibility protein-domain-containing protein [Xylariaceae sp. AK1471]
MTESTLAESGLTTNSELLDQDPAEYSEEDGKGNPIKKASPDCPVCGDLDQNNWEGRTRRITMKDLRCSSLSCSPCAAIVDGLSKTVNLNILAKEATFSAWSLNDASLLIFVLDFDGFPTPELMVEFYTHKEFPKPWPAIGHARPLTVPFSRKDTQRINQWFKECMEDHPVCSQGETILPTRVIVVGSDTGDCEPYLYETKHDKGQYVTLSHCWGEHEPGPLITTTRNIHLHKKSIPLSTLPDTFLDTIYLTRDLGIHYLWIDSLCIIQDDNDDWVRESTHMTDIYRNATLTISADGAVDSHAGLFRTVGRRQPAATVTIDHPEMAGKSKSPVYARMVSLPSRVHQITSVRDQPLRRRAWALQEWLLSSRVIHFIAGELLWECKAVQGCECQVASQPLVSLGISEDQRPMWLFKPTFYYRENDGNDGVSLFAWQNVVSEFTSRKLTYDSDKLPAIAGLARLSKKNNEDYIAGLWKSELPESLLWRVDSTQSKRYDQYVAPSWSWASVTSGVRFPHKYSRYMHNKCKILEACHTLASSNPYGAVSGGFIKIKGTVANLFVKEQVEYYSSLRCWIYTDKERSYEAYVVFDSAESAADSKSVDYIPFLIIGSDSEGSTIYGLAMKNTWEHDRTFTRIGYVEVFKDKQIEFIDVDFMISEEIITII